MATNFANNNMFFTYLQLKPGTDVAALQAKFPAFIDKYAGKDLKAQGFYKNSFSTKLTDIHLYSGMNQNVTPPGSVTYLYILTSIALFTLLIACINFMNLSTARSSKQKRRSGYPQVLVPKSALVRQFLGESVFMSLIAFVFAFALVWFLLLAFNKLAGKELSLSFSQNTISYAVFPVLSVITGIVAGSPAFTRLLSGRLKYSKPFQQFARRFRCARLSFSSL